MITLRQSVDLALAAYADPPDLVGPLDNHPVRIHYVERDGMLYVIPEGSKTLEDWKDDFRGWAVLDMPKLLHGGALIPEAFYASCRSIKDVVRQRIGTGPYCMVGHSRGGAQAPVLVKMMTDDGAPSPAAMFLLEPARAFFFKIPAVFDNINVQGTWNGNDPVPHVPFGEQFVLTKFGHRELEMFDNHHLVNVAKAMDAAGVGTNA